MTHAMTRLATLATVLCLTACPDDDDGDTNNTTVSTTAPTTTSPSDSSGGNEESTGGEEESSGPSTTTPAEESSTAPADSSSGEGGGCNAQDECIEDNDCAGGGLCIDCICVGGEESGGDCTPGACGECADVNMCVACVQMMMGECETENVACNMNPECNALIMCSNMCGMDMKCAQQCATDHPDGVEAFNALIGCAQMNCL